MTEESYDWRKKPRNRGANADWQEIFFLLYRRHQFKAFDQQHVREAIEKIPLSITPESLRVKLSRYVKLELLEKPARQRYQLTPKGAQFFRVKKMTMNALLSEDNAQEDNVNSS
jgi:predicted transcriptional regulator